VTKNFIPFTDKEEKLVEKLTAKRNNAEIRFPLTFGLLATFGFVSILYGFEKLIDRVGLFVQNPWILLIICIVTLLLTGTAYKKLN
jgi:hypothetical protein